MIGAGIIGLSVAWRLAQQGLQVTIVERREPGCGATSAAAGMLAPLAEAAGEGEFVQLGLESLAMYDGFLQELSDATGDHLTFSERGMLRVALSEVEEEELRAAAGWQQRFGLPLETLSGKELRTFEPALTERASFAIYSPRERSVDPRAINAALREAAVRAGVRLVTGDAALDVGLLSVSGERWRAATIILAAGAWSGLLSTAAPVAPVRGQILSLRTEQLPQTTLFSHAGYVVPRGELVLVGATEEHAGFDCVTTAGGIDHLTTAARKLLAGSELTVVSAAAGLRPGTPDRLPIIGRIAGSNVIAATGHYRNGILLAPLTARIVADLVVHGAEHELAGAVSPSRFATVGAPS